MIEPEILLLDEPLSNLDARLRDEMRFEIRDIQTRTGITTLFVTHDQQEALTMSDRIAVMNAGRLEQIGTPTEVYDRAATPFVANFIGRANNLSSRLSLVGGQPVLVCDGQTLPQPQPADLPENSVSGNTVAAMIRPHAIRLTPPVPDGVSGTVMRRVFVGSMIETEIRLDGGQTLIAELRPNSADAALANLGARVSADWLASDMRLFAS